MPEFRARQIHRDRVAETIRDEISSMMAGELADPRIGSAFVTEVVLAPGGKSARVFVALASQDGEDSSTTIDGLVAARGFIRYELRERMGVRHVPELSFHIDTSDGIKGRIGDLLGRAEKNTKKLAAKHAAAKATAAQSAKEAQ
jgi:ribosome-binding factor A